KEIAALTAKLEQAQQAAQGSPADAEAHARAVEAAYRAIRRAMIRASCDASSLEGLDRFDATHAKAAERLVSADFMDVCQGLVQVRTLKDARAGPYVAFYMREYGPVGDFAIQAGVYCRHPLVITAAIERLRGPAEIRIMDDEDNPLGIRT